MCLAPHGNSSRARRSPCPCTGSTGRRTRRVPAVPAVPRRPPSERTPPWSRSVSVTSAHARASHRSPASATTRPGSSRPRSSHPPTTWSARPSAPHWRHGQRQRHPRRAAGARPARAGTATRRRRTAWPPGGPTASSSTIRCPPSTPRMTAPDGAVTLGVLGRARHRTGQRGGGAAPRGDPGQGQERPPRPPLCHPDQPLPHLGPVARRRADRPARRRHGPRCSTPSMTTVSATSSGDSTTRRPWRR